MRNKAGMKFDCIFEEPLDFIDIDYTKLNRTIRYEQRPHGEWIPCKERLPEEDGKYLVKWCGDWGVDVCIAEYSHCGKYWYRDSDGYEFRDITAWMPLP